MKEENKLPKNWSKIKVSEAGKLLRGINYKKQDARNHPEENFLPVLRGNNINGELNFENLVFVTKKNIQTEQVLKKGDIVFAMSSGSKHLVGKSAKVKTDFNGSFGAFCGAFRTSENYDKDFIAYFFQSPFYKKVISEISKGTSINNLKREHILDLELPCPPPLEQQVIVTKIEELFSQLENGKQQLLTAQKQLKIYRQSLLKSAFEGKLSKSWRRKQKKLISAELIIKRIQTEKEKNSKISGKKLKPLVPITDAERAELPNLPKEWAWVKLGDNAFVTKLAGFEFTKYVKYKDKGDIPVIRAQNVSRCSFIPRNFLYVDKEIMEKLPRSRIFGGEILMVFVGAGLGNVGIVPNNKEYFLGPNVSKIVLEKQFINKFVFHFLTSKAGFANITGMTKATAQGSISMTNIREVLIPLISIEEQNYILQELERKLTICDKIEETISSNLQQVDTLKQSILKKAFEGKLVKPQQEIVIYKPRNEYFYQMQLMGWVLAISKQKKIQHGEMTSAKYIYLIDRIFGIPTFYEFKRGHLGPFPAAIKKAINNKQYFKKIDGHIEVINENTLFRSVNPYTDKAKKAVNEIADFFSKYKAKERAHKTELLATICKVIEDIQTTDLKSVRNSMEEWSIELKNQPNSTKAAKFSEEETSKCLQFLKDKGWDQKILK